MYRKASPEAPMKLEKPPADYFPHYNRPSYRDQSNRPCSTSRKMVKKPASKKSAGTKPSSTKRSAQKAQASTSDEISPSNLQSPKDQQRLLNIFSDAFNNVLSSDHFPTLLQEIKQALFNRDFSGAFGREDYLEAYAARWSPTRALCYASVFRGIQGHLDEIYVLNEDEAIGSLEVAESDEAGSNTDQNAPDPSKSVDAQTANSSETSTSAGGVENPASSEAVTKTRNLRMICIGGCAAEHLAFASYLHDTNSHGNLTLLDSAPWATVTNLLQTKITTPPPLSKYASAAVKASNKALLEPGRLSLTFTQQDILSLDVPQLSEILGSTPTVVTMLFTLNELYTSGGIAKTTKLLKNLGQVLPDASLLLVVDSPGSYSEAALGKEKKRYPMQWLLDHTLLETETTGYQWEKLVSEESVWFRLPEELSYPISLENMRYQQHLYRLTKDA